jgi:ATP-dependent exoDNAse (exonuclease V) alpha subunit
MIELTTEQTDALDAVRGWYGCGTSQGSGEPFRLFGYAGVGKTTLAREIAGRLGLRDVVFGAYTGKAASVLRKKGVPASTIHSAIYRIESEKDEDGVRHPVFGLNPESEWADAELIVLDEVSMVNGDMARDIESFGVPVLVLGDPAQLPPVGGYGHYIHGEPDVMLTHIHRQALESPVLELATRIRQSTDDTLGVRPDEISVASVSAAMEAEQVLCWRNATRWKLTDRIRAKLGRPAGKVVAGDRVICLVNNKRDLGVLNGQQFDVLDVKDDWTLLLRETGETHGERWISVYPDGFAGLAGEAELKNKRAFRGPVGAFTYANVITVHKAQGSEWDSVYIVDETAAMMAMKVRREGETAAALEGRRFLYTGVTRAREAVTLARLRTG